MHGAVAEPYAAEWLRVLGLSTADLCGFPVDPGERAQAKRQCSRFAGAAVRSDWARGPVPDPPLVRFEPSTAGAWDLTYQIDGFESATLPGVVVREDADVEVEVRLRRKP